MKVRGGMWPSLRMLRGEGVVGGSAEIRKALKYLGTMNIQGTEINPKCNFQ